MPDDVDAERDQLIERVVDRLDTLFEVLDIMADGGDAMAVKKFLTKQEILAQDDLRYEDIQVPEWGGAWVRVRGMSASQRDEFEASTVQRNGKSVTTNLQNIRARLCIMCLVDENGEQLFQHEDTFPLGAKSAAALDRIFQVAQRLNGLREEDVNELAANFPGDQNGDSPTD